MQKIFGRNEQNYKIFNKSTKNNGMLKLKKFGVASVVVLRETTV